MNSGTMDHDEEYDRFRQQLDNGPSSGCVQAQDVINERSRRESLRPGSCGGLLCKVVLSSKIPTTSKDSILPSVKHTFSSLADLTDGSEFLVRNHNDFHHATAVENKEEDRRYCSMHRNPLGQAAIQQSRKIKQQTIRRYDATIDFGSTYPLGPHLFNAQRQNSRNTPIYLSYVEEAGIVISDRNCGNSHQKVLHAKQTGIGDLKAIANICSETILSQTQCLTPSNTATGETVSDGRDNDSSPLISMKQQKQSRRNSWQHRFRLLLLTAQARITESSKVYASMDTSSSMVDDTLSSRRWRWSSCRPVMRTSLLNQKQEEEIVDAKRSNCSKSTGYSSSTKPIQEMSASPSKKQEKRFPSRSQLLASTPLGTTKVTLEKYFKNLTNLTPVTASISSASLDRTEPCATVPPSRNSRTKLEKNMIVVCSGGQFDPPIPANVVFSSRQRL